jgi:hypothetical protein
MLNEKSRVKGDFHARFCERLGLKCPCLLGGILCRRVAKVGGSLVLLLGGIVWVKLGMVRDKRGMVGVKSGMV